MSDFLSIQEVLDSEPESPYRTETEPKHALLSASGSHRWLNCPPSARLEAGYPDQSSEYAKEGTLAHAWAENELAYMFKQKSLNDYHKRKKELQENELFNSDMYKHIELYKLQIEEWFIRYGKTIQIEKTVNFSKYVPEGFGTCDCLITGEDTVIICDLKYGMGVPVSAENNSQLKLYALGALESLDKSKIKKVITVIIQPRLDSISSCEYTLDDLQDFADYIEPVVTQAYKGEGEMQIGDWCRFCKHKNNCMKQIEEAFGILDYPAPEEISTEVLTELLRKRPIITDFLSSIESYALARVRDKGERIPGFKLVHARTIRKYTDTQAVSEAVLGAGLGDTAFKPKEPLSISQMEKLLGKARFNELLGDYVAKPEGEPVLVPVSDKREEIQTDRITVNDAFENIF